LQLRPEKAQYKSMPIGSCRVRQLLIRAGKDLGLTVDVSSQYALIYNTKEILQQIRHMAGDFTIPLAARRFLDHTKTDWVDTGSAFSAETYFVEISNPTIMAWNGVFLAQNAVCSVLAQAGAQAIWQILWHGRWDDERALRREIQASPEFAQLPPDLRDFLTSITVSVQTPGELLADMRSILDLLGAEKVVFLSKATGAKTNGLLPRERQQFIREIRDCADELGAVFFDPTPMLHAFGQERAFADGGLDVSHYTPEFESRLLEVLVAPYLASGASRAA